MYGTHLCSHFCTYVCIRVGQYKFLIHCQCYKSIWRTIINIAVFVKSQYYCMHNISQCILLSITVYWNLSYNTYIYTQYYNTVIFHKMSNNIINNCDRACKCWPSEHKKSPSLFIFALITVYTTATKSWWLLQNLMGFNLKLTDMRYYILIRRY